MRVMLCFLGGLALLVSVCGSPLADVSIPGFTLSNAAAPNIVAPAVGLGTGGYGNKMKQPIGVYPECWSDGQPDPDGHTNGVDCAESVINATATWLMLGGRRIDSGDTYDNVRAIAAGMKASGVARSDIFLVSKIGSGLPMGPDEVDHQIAWMLEQYDTDYIDLILIHWPTTGSNSTDPVCVHGSQYNATKCRIACWKQLISHFKDGKVKAIGVSNYNTEHLKEIKDAGLIMPAVNQCPYNPHLYSAQSELIKYCKTNGILFNSYSPLGIPDWHKYPSSISTTGLIIEEPAILKIAGRYKMSAAQILLAWQYTQGIMFNPRSMSATHMKENLDPAVYSTKFSTEDIAVLQSFKPDACSLDSGKNHWYECCGDPVHGQPSLPVCN